MRQRTFTSSVCQVNFDRSLSINAFCRRFPSQCMWCEKIFNQLSNVGGLSTKPSVSFLSCPIIRLSFIESRSTGASPYGCAFCGEHSGTRLRGTSTCYAFMAAVQERARRNSDLRSLLKNDETRRPDHSLLFVAGAKHSLHCCHLSDTVTTILEKSATRPDINCARILPTGVILWA